MLNLDCVCIECAQNITADADGTLENNLRKALGVLQEDGVYAMFLWLENKEGGNVRRRLVEMLNKGEIRKHLLDESFNEDNFKAFCGQLKKVSRDLDKLLFVKKLFERTLIYALYHAKIG
jgi:hypothetical protein